MASTDDLIESHRARNVLHSLVLLGGMFGLFGALGWVLVGGWLGVVLLGAIGLISAGFGAGASSRLVLRMYRARPLERAQAPSLFRMIDELARRAGLARPPQPYYVPSRMINAFAVGTPDDAALGISDGLLRTLAPREVRGVLAHEITHIRNNDAWVMGLADWISRMVSLFSWFGQIMLLFALPAVLMGARPPISLGLLLLLIFAPTLSALMQLALSRAREYDADLGAARLSGDPRGLASALARMERLQGGFLERVLLPGRRVPDPSLLRTHPPTEERVRRLLAVEKDLARADAAVPPDLDVVDTLPPAPARGPRWHIPGGTWH